MLLGEISKNDDEQDEVEIESFVPTSITLLFVICFYLHIYQH